MGMPGWGLALGALVKGPEYINSGLELYKNIAANRDVSANEQAAKDSIDNLAWAAQEEDPKVRLANFREISRDMSGRPLNASTALALQKEVDTQAKGAMSDIKTAQTGSDLAAFQKEAAASGSDLFTYAQQHPDKIPLTALQGAHNVFATLATGSEKEMERRAKAESEAAKIAYDQEQQNNLAQFQSAISGVGGGYRDAQPVYPGQPTPPDADPRTGLVYKDAAGNPTQNRLMPFADARNLYMQAASDYKVDPSKAIDDLTKQYEATYTDANGQPSDLNWMGKEATRTKEQLYSAAERGDVKAKAILQKMQADEIKQSEAKRQVIVNNPTPPSMSVKMNELTPEEQTALNVAISEKRLDPYKINSKNQKVLASAALSTPGVDLNAISAQMGVARNKDVIMKAGVAEMLPGLIQKTAEAGKALNYSNAKFIGIAEKWKNGQINDPKLTRYMTLRNDQLLTIGSVMRGNGMTDMAQKLEEEAMHPTLSPRALDQWVESQLESIDPRLNLYRNLTKGNQAIPRSNYQPGTGGKGLNAQPQSGKVGKYSYTVK